MSSWLTFAAERMPELWLRTGEHILLTGISTCLAVLLGIPLGMLAARHRRLRAPLTGAVGILQTVPSLAMLAILLALLRKIGALPAVIALTLYGLLPIVRNTLAGLDNIPPSVREAARGIGMTAGQRLRWVEIPLAAPVLIAGIRTAAVVGVGIATLSAFIGAGGLGQFINRGLALSNTNLLLLGAVPAALLALAVDGSIAAAEWALRRRRSSRVVLKDRLVGLLRPVALTLPGWIFLVGLLAVFTDTSGTRSADRASETPIRVGCKNFTEQLILGEMLAQIIQFRTGLAVERKFDLAGTMICHRALIHGEIDLYPEYTGTALATILKSESNPDASAVPGLVRDAYRERFACAWLSPFGFNNTYALTMRRQDAAARGIRTLSDLAKVSPNLRAAFTFEFSEREDGYPGLRRKYDLQFGEVRDLDISLMYEAVAQQQVDVICAFATDGRISAYDLLPLEDDRRFFPPYEAAPVVREETLRKHPRLREVLNSLAGVLTDGVMQRLNYAVDEEKKSPKEVAAGFLLERGLIPSAVD